MNPKKSLILILLIISSVLILYFFVLPGWNKFNDKKVRLGQVETEKQNLIKAQTDLEGFLKEFESYETEANTLNAALPLTKPEISEVLDGLEQLAQASGLLLSQLAFIEQSAEEKSQASVNSISALEVEFISSGSYASFQNFFLRLENNLRIMDILNISLTVDDGTGDIEAQIKFKTYYQN